MRRVPAIDMHAHIEPDITAGELLDLGALVFAATRSLDEAERVLGRSDPWTIWGVGCHPGLVRAQKDFDQSRFASLIERTAFVSETGLDGKSRVPMHVQQATFSAVLNVLAATPRLVSIHSFAATDEVLQCLESCPAKGAILHWWLGNERQTTQALELGCYFSVNSSMLRNPEVATRLPLDRVLPETDHPFGDKASGRGRRPGNVADIELILASAHGIGVQDLRNISWQNLARLVRVTKCGGMLPRAARIALVTFA